MKTPKEKAKEIIKNHLIAISQETIDNEDIILYTAKECAKVTVNYLKLNCPANMEMFWQEVKDEI